MPMVLPDAELENDLGALLRLQDVLLQAAEGARGSELDAEYRKLRRSLLDDSNYGDVIPTFVRRYRDLGSLWPALKSYSPQWEPRRGEIRLQFEEALSRAVRMEVFGQTGPTNVRYDSSAWTGATSGAEQVRAIKTLFPVAQSALEILIAELETPNHNGNPPLDETAAAIEHLRQLHRTLGKMLDLADNGKLGLAISDGLPQQAAKYAKRAARALRDDPMPYAVSATILAVLTACGVPDIGGYLTGVALSMKKRSQSHD